MKKTPLEIILRKSMPRSGGGPPDPAAIRGYQLDKLRQTVEHARANCPFYRTKLAGIRANAITDDRMLSLLPFTSEEELRRRGDEMLCVSQDEVARIITMQSSGTTGAPKRLFFTGDDLERTIDFFHHGMKSLVKPGQRVLILLPGATPDSTGDLLARALKRMNVTSLIFGLVEDPHQAARAIFAESFDVMVGFPVQVLALSRTADGRQLKPGRIKSVLLCSDYIARTVCRELSARWRCRVFSHYGTVETGLGGGVECAGLCGCHLREADLLFEVISPETGASCGPGEDGEIVFSTLTRRAMPLIRYRTGDYGRLLGGACACGSRIARLGRVHGRISQLRHLENGHTLSMGMLDERLLSIPDVFDFQAALQKDAGRDRLSVRFAVARNSGDQVMRQAALLLENMAQLRNIQVSLAAHCSGRIHKGKRIIEDRRGTSSHEKAYQTGL